MGNVYSRLDHFSDHFQEHFCTLFALFAFKGLKFFSIFLTIFQQCNKKLAALALKPKFFQKDGEFLPILDAIPILQEATKEVYQMGLSNAKNTQIDKVKQGIKDHGLRDQRSNFVEDHRQLIKLLWKKDLEVRLGQVVIKDQTNI